jgi:hypothetical protein
MLGSLLPLHQDVRLGKLELLGCNLSVFGGHDREAQ